MRALYEKSLVKFSIYKRAAGVTQLRETHKGTRTLCIGCFICQTGGAVNSKLKTPKLIFHRLSDRG